MTKSKLTPMLEVETDSKCNSDHDSDDTTLLLYQKTIEVSTMDKFRLAHMYEVETNSKSNSDHEWPYINAISNEPKGCNL